MAEVIMYTKDDCPYCDRAKNLLKRKGVDFKEISIEGKPEEFTKLKNRTGMMTVPQIFIDGKLVGGFTELAALDRDSTLDQMLSLP